AAESGPAAIAQDGSLLDGAHSPVLERAIHRRLAGLAPDARAVAEALAILGDCASPVHVATLARVDGEAVSAARDPLRVAGLLGRGPELAFAHPVIRQAVAAGVAPGVRAL